MSAWIDFEPKPQAPQAKDPRKAAGINWASIDGDDEEASEAQG